MSKELVIRLREAAAQRVASAAMIGADDLIAAADALESATAGMGAYCNELAHCRDAAGFGSSNDPMAQDGFDAFGDPLCVAAFVESQFKRVVAERDALAADLKDAREQLATAMRDAGEFAHQSMKAQDEMKALRKQKPVVVIGSVYQLLWAGSGPIAPIVEKHGLKVGSKLYAHPVPARELTASDIHEIRMAAEFVASYQPPVTISAKFHAEKLKEIADRLQKGGGQ